MTKRRTPDSGSTPGAVKDLLLRLLAVTKYNDFQLSPQMLEENEEIEAISIEGADPEWQIQELQRILDRWAIQH